MAVIASSITCLCVESGEERYGFSERRSKKWRGVEHLPDGAVTAVHARSSLVAEQTPARHHLFRVLFSDERGVGEVTGEGTAVVEKERHRIGRVAGSRKD